MSAIEKILDDAYRAGATDVHMVAGSRPVMRVLGQLTGMDHSRLSAQDTLDFVLRFLPENQRDVLEEKGEVQFSLSFSECGRVRVSAYKKSGAVTLAIRLLGDKVPRPEELNIPEKLVSLCGETSGLVLVSGAAGCGKTTTLAALVHRLNETRPVHIMTLEHPVEYIHPQKLALVNQRDVGVDCVSYVEALGTVGMQDVDVLVLGQLRGAEAIEEVLRVAESGVLVFVELTAADGRQALEALVESFEPHRQAKMERRIKNVLSAVVFQQLLTKEGGGQYATYEMLDL